MTIILKWEDFRGNYECTKPFSYLHSFVTGFQCSNSLLGFDLQAVLWLLDKTFLVVHKYQHNIYGYNLSWYRNDEFPVCQFDMAVFGVGELW
jgi:hypothetical protein